MESRLESFCTGKLLRSICNLILLNERCCTMDQYMIR